MHIRYCQKYKLIKARIENENNKKDFRLIDQFFFDESGKIKWDTICPLLPAEIESTIQNEYNNLSINEIRLCCLLLFSVPSTDILDILPYARRSIYSTTYKIKKNSGMKNIKKSLRKLLQSHLIK